MIPLPANFHPNPKLISENVVFLSDPNYIYAGKTRLTIDCGASSMIPDIYNQGHISVNQNSGGYVLLWEIVF